MLVKQPQMVISLSFILNHAIIKHKATNRDLTRTCCKQGGLYCIKCIPTSLILEAHCATPIQSSISLTKHHSLCSLWHFRLHHMHFNALKALQQWKAIRQSMPKKHHHTCHQIDSDIHLLCLYHQIAFLFQQDGLVNVSKVDNSLNLTQKNNLQLHDQCVYELRSSRFSVQNFPYPWF